MQVVSINGETVAIITLYGENRHPEVTQWHRRVMVEHFGLPVNYVLAPFPACSHGSAMNQLLQQSVDKPGAPDYYLWLDNDCVMLRREALGLAYQQVRDRMTVWGHAWNSAHKLSPNYTIFHPYASQACLMFPREMYKALGRPDMDHHHSRSDTAEEFTYAAKTAGFSVNLLYPSFSIVADTPLDHNLKAYGMGNVYGPLSRPQWCHVSSAPNPRHVETFIETAKMVLSDAFEGDNPAKPYGYHRA